MALALDELQEDDEKYEVEGLTFLVAKSVLDVVKSYGSVKIDYLDYPWGGQLVVKANGAASC